MTDPTFPDEDTDHAVGADLGPGAADPDDRTGDPHEAFPSRTGVAGVAPGGEEAPGDVNPAADPGPGFPV
jgi:hypothetical protein